MPRRIAVAGSGPAGLSAALVAATRGHAVTLFEAAPAIGGQLNLARTIPGKEEFHGLVHWYARMVADAGIDLRLGTRATAADLDGFDHVIVATGVLPRDPGIEGQDLPHVASYADILTGRVTAGPRTLVVGAGGIGFDVADFLVSGGHSTTEDLPLWLAEWGVSDPARDRGGIAPAGPRPEPPARKVTLVQRRAGRPGRGLGKTTGWIHRAGLAMRGVEMLGGLTYDRIEPGGLRVRRTPEAEPELLPADTIVLCTGQEPLRTLADDLAGRSNVHVIGGADVAAELDAKRAIDQGARLAATL